MSSWDFEVWLAMTSDERLGGGQGSGSRLRYFPLAWHLENHNGNPSIEPQFEMLNAAYFKRAPAKSPIQLVDVAARLVVDYGAAVLGPSNSSLGDGGGGGGGADRFVLPDFRQFQRTTDASIG